MKIGALVPIRLGSERLPGKHLLPIGDKPAVIHLLERLFASRHLVPGNVVVCTTEEATDDRLVPVVEGTGARVFRGSRDDIIHRFDAAVRAHRFDAVIQVDGDDPFTDTGYMDACMDRLLGDERLDLVMSEGLPIGLNSKAIRARAIARVLEHRVTEKNDHGFILLFTETGLCRCETIGPASSAHVHARARITLDYPEDLRFFDALYRAIGERRPPFGVAEIVAMLNARPELVEINAHLDEQYRERSDDLLSLQYLRDGQLHQVGEPR